MFARRSNPAIDKPILRKNLSYCEEQVRYFMADWVDPFDPKKGIVALEMLASGKRLETVECESLDGSSYFNLKRVPTAPEWKNPTLPRLNYIPQAEAFGELLTA